jgi:hypothetical protein
LQNRRKEIITKIAKNSAKIHPKKAKGIVIWINKGYSAIIDKKKALEWLEALRNHHGTELNNQELDFAAKIIEDFENPKHPEENADEGIRFSKVYHGSGAEFDKFDHTFMGSG